MYQDTVIEHRLLAKPAFVAGMFASIFVIFFMFDLSQTFVGALLEPAIGDPEQSGWYGRFAIALTVATALMINIIAIGFMPFKYQVVVVWLQLLICFLAFFYGFNLSMEFIRKKIWFMISQGVATTLYISAISIVIAFALALVGAVAKLSSNGFAFAIASFILHFFAGCRC